MKKLLFLPLLLMFFSFQSCEDDKEANLSNVAVPVTQSIADFRASVKVQEPRTIQESGKIYAWKDYIFINDKNEGVHIIDNTDPFNPQNIKFLKIPRNMDIAIKNEKLYADNGMDLVVFDISNIDKISEVGRVQDVFPNYYATAPEGVSYVDFASFDPSQEVIIGYLIEKRKIEYARDDSPMPEFANGDSGGGTTGTGGSMARFSLNDNYLYVADESSLSAFDISTPSNPIRISNEYIGWQIETIFNYQDHLYLGSSTGMYIYSIENPEKPEKLSFLQHVLGCDPVVVKDNYAYVTIRGGNACGQDLNQLEIVDISDKAQPEVVGTYGMVSPYGLGVKDNWLFVCDGSAGLKIFGIENTPNLEYIDQFNNINTYDVIPLDERLLMVGDNILSQYSYKGNEINLISTFNLN
ncbi:LVIVD repeat-containing protein [Christiangramia forsetii]|uniref:LVIVD repeat-containing protein n=2 Tax=Christiangramia forsetii TaxID=411153 RepID=A0M7D2_CHRFK|nr:hypothetical protein [Christiangramia forsetii]CAL68527.1 conserved hypothetical protein, secreted [Christiangramia forsetii KT0803]